MRHRKFLSFISSLALLALTGCVCRGPIRDPEPPPLPPQTIDPEVAANHIVTSLLIRSPLRRLDTTHRVTTSLESVTADMDDVWLRMRLKLNGEPHIVLVDAGASPAWVLRGRPAPGSAGQIIAVALFPAGGDTPVWTFRQPLSESGD